MSSSSFQCSTGSSRAERLSPSRDSCVGAAAAARFVTTKSTIAQRNTVLGWRGATAELTNGAETPYAIANDATRSPALERLTDRSSLICGRTPAMTNASVPSANDPTASRLAPGGSASDGGRSRARRCAPVESAPGVMVIARVLLIGEWGRPIVRLWPLRCLGTA